MLFYTTLFIGSLVLVSVLLWLCILVVGRFQSKSRSRFPNVEQTATAHLSERKYGRNSKRASRAWGIKPHSTPANLARTHPAKVDELAPVRWQGNDHEGHEHHPQGGATLSDYLARKDLEDKAIKSRKQNAGQPKRDNGSRLSGRAYTPSQDAISTFAIDKKTD